MGWWPWSSDTTTDSNDPLRDLDPSLREFLSKESPIKYKPAAEPSPPSRPTPDKPPPPPSTDKPASKPLVPSASLYPDGRYAHLWSTYRPLSDIENETKSDQEKLADVLDGYKARKAQIGRAAVENCVFEQIQLSDCYEHGGARAKMTMCNKENKEFNRCYVMQSRFLKALGYLSTYERPPSVDEAIQMHADTLYHRMLDQEAATEAAKAAGEPAPTFTPILSPETAPNTPNPVPSNSPSDKSSSTPADPADTLPPLSATTVSLLNPASQLRLREKLQGMVPYERELEERSVQMEARTAGDIAARMKEVEAGRKKRREEGKGTPSDTVAGWFGW